MEEKEILFIDEEFSPLLTEGECEDLKPIMKDFMEAYTQNADKPAEEWLGQKMGEYLPDKSPEEIKNVTNEIITSIRVTEEKKSSLAAAISNGRSKESWFASEVKKATSAMSMEGQVKYLSGLDTALKDANNAMFDVITTKAGSLSKNPCLDGFIAEEFHAQTFNLNAAAAGSPYRAEALKPNGQAYAKNSVDIVIRDIREASKTNVKRYQSKYCKDAAESVRKYNEGNYRGQQFLAPADQIGDIPKKATAVIESPDGITSNPLTKPDAKQLQNEAQSGNWKEMNWNEYNTKDLAMGVGRQIGHAAIQGAAIGVGIDIAQKLWNGEEIKGEEVVETALTSGTDFGVKAAAAGALKVGAEKGAIKCIPSGTPAGDIANIAFIAVENVKILGKMATGELSGKEGLEKMELTTMSAITGLATIAATADMVSKVGEVVGGAVGTFIAGPAGTAVGAVVGKAAAAVTGFVAGSVAYMAGSKYGEVVVKTAQKIRDKVVSTAKEIGARVGTTIKNGAEKLATAVKNGIGKLKEGAQKVGNALKKIFA